MKVRLTQRFIDTGTLHCPEGKRRIEYCDTDLPGLYVEARTTSPGEGTYYLRYKNKSGKTCHQRLGRTTEISLDQARQMVKQMKAKITLGEYPGDDQAVQKAELTFQDFFNQHYLPHVQPRKRTWKKDEEYFRLRLKADFGHLQLKKITRQQIMAFHTRLKNEGLAAATCNHYVKLLKHSLNLAVEWDLLESNPATKIPLFHEDNQVEHYLEPEQLVRLLTVLETDKNRTVCQIILWQLAVGSRLGESLKA